MIKFLLGYSIRVNLKQVFKVEFTTYYLQTPSKLQEKAGFWIFSILPKIENFPQLLALAFTVENFCLNIKSKLLKFCKR